MADGRHGRIADPPTTGPGPPPGPSGHVYPSAPGDGGQGLYPGALDDLALDDLGGLDLGALDRVTGNDLAMRAAPYLPQPGFSAAIDPASYYSAPGWSAAPWGAEPPFGGQRAPGGGDGHMASASPHPGVSAPAPARTETDGFAVPHARRRLRLSSEQMAARDQKIVELHDADAARVDAERGKPLSHNGIARQVTDALGYPVHQQTVSDTLSAHRPKNAREMARNQKIVELHDADVARVDAEGGKPLSHSEIARQAGDALGYPVRHQAVDAVLRADRPSAQRDLQARDQKIVDLHDADVARVAVEGGEPLSHNGIARQVTDALGYLVHHQAVTDTLSARRPKNARVLARNQKIVELHDADVARVDAEGGKPPLHRGIARQATDALGYLVSQPAVGAVLRAYRPPGAGMGGVMPGPSAGGCGALVRADPVQMAHAAGQLRAGVSAGQADIDEVQHIGATMSGNWSGEVQQAFTTMAGQATGALRSNVANMASVADQLDHVGQGFTNTDHSFAQSILYHHQ